LLGALILGTILVSGHMDATASRLIVEIEREDDGRWMAEVLALPGVLAYGTTREEAVAKCEALALRVLADRLEHGEAVPELSVLFEPA
jgi:predicted RNase H-like HicB family nuclease